ncbi:MAG: PEP-CTERM sorting domain-containing protein [Pirellulaceae bacterium]
MHPIRLFAIYVLLLAVPAISGAAVLPFFEDFEDGDATDGSPATWSPGAQPTGTRIVSGGDYIFTASSLASSYVEESADLVGDISIQTQIRFLETNAESYAGVFARSPDFRSYWGGITDSGQLYIGEELENGTSTNVRGPVSTGINARVNDALLQFDVFGNTIGLTAWEDGRDKPMQPQISFQDDSLVSGTFGLFIQSNASTKVAFRWFEAVPEPSTLVLLVFGLLYLVQHRISNPLFTAGKCFDAFSHLNHAGAPKTHATGGLKLWH